MARTEKSYTGWYFLVVVMVLTAILFLFLPQKLLPTLNYFFNLINRILPVLFFVFALMFVINLFVTPQMLIRYMGKEAKHRGWLVSVISGIVSVGPIYMWYPLLSELKDKGVRTAYMATFLYNRAVKPALLPLIVFYFGLKFTIILTIVMIFFSIVQGIIVEKLVD